MPPRFKILDVDFKKGFRYEIETVSGTITGKVAEVYANAVVLVKDTGIIVTINKEYIVAFGIIPCGE